MLLLFILTSGILIVFLLLKNENNNHLKDDLHKKRIDVISKIEIQNNYTMKNTSNILLGRMEMIQRLTKQLTESEKERVYDE
jgi:hypothetical protein